MTNTTKTKGTVGVVGMQLISLLGYPFFDCF